MDLDTPTQHKQKQQSDTAASNPLMFVASERVIICTSCKVAVPFPEPRYLSTRCPQASLSLESYNSGSDWFCRGLKHKLLWERNRSICSSLAEKCAGPVTSLCVGPNMGYRDGDLLAHFAGCWVSGKCREWVEEYWGKKGHKGIWKPDNEDS